MAVEQAGLSRVKPEERKSWGSVAFIWAGSVVCVPALMVGGFITSGLSFASAALAMLLGYLFCVIIMVFMGMQSTDLGIPVVAAAGGAFGETGARYVVSTIISVCFICWFGFQSAVCGEAFSSFAAMIGLNIPVKISILLWGAIMLITAVYGIGWIRILNIISVPALILMIIYNLYVVFSDPAGAAKIVSYAPQTAMPFVAAVGMAVGGFASGAVLSGDITRYCRDRRGTILSSVVGVIPMGVVTLLVGGILAIYTGALGMDNNNFVAMLASIGSPVLALLVLILATWTTNVSNAYSSGFALLNLSGAKDSFRPYATLIAGVIGTLLAIFGILGVFNSFINLLAVFIPPVAGCVIADYWLINRGKPDRWKPGKGINWIGIVSLVAGAGITLLLPSFFIAPVNAIVIAAAVYCILTKVTAKQL